MVKRGHPCPLIRVLKTMFSRLKLRTKLIVLLGLSVSGAIVSIVCGTITVRERMM